MKRQQLIKLALNQYHKQRSISTAVWKNTVPALAPVAVAVAVAAAITSTLTPFTPSTALQGTRLLNRHSHRRYFSVMEALPCAKRLAVFDFDYTVVEQNTDTVVRDLLLPNKLPKDLSDLIDSAGWTEYMAAVFRLLHEHNFKPEKIRDAIRGIPEVPGFVRLLKRLHQCHSCDVIVISDSNSIFIAEWLQAHGLSECILQVFTNPAQFEASGLLTIKPYHHQTDCRLSAPNLCKGKVLEHFLIEQDLRLNRRYDSIIYVGDGNNDICPVIRCLRGPNDYACARTGYALEKSLVKNREKFKLRSQLVSWQNGFELLQALESAFAGDDNPKRKSSA